tara:strand:- start:324 stop:986 length:663 start_codon:yes stop_codon:yes gene_type:complete
MSLILVNDVTNSKLRELKCNASGELSVEKVDNSLLATEASLSALDAKVSACDTSSISGTVAVSAVSGDVACTHASLPLPTGAATEASLVILSNCVTANKLDVSSAAAPLSATSVYVFGSQGSPTAELSNLDATSAVVDVDAFSKVLVAGSTTKLDAEFQIEVSSDNLDWFDLQDKFVNVDYASGHFGLIMDAPFKYMRVKRLADAAAAGSDSISCIISGK